MLPTASSEVRLFELDNGTTSQARLTKEVWDYERYAGHRIWKGADGTNGKTYAFRSRYRYTCSERFPTLHVVLGQPEHALSNRLQALTRDVRGITVHVRFVPYSPLGRGFLTSAVKPGHEYAEDDMCRWDERWQGENYDYNLRATEQLKNLAAAKGITVARLALAWLQAQGDDIVPILGTRSATRIEEKAGAADVELTPADLQRIVEVLPHGSAGGRYPAAYMPTDW